MLLLKQIGVWLFPLNNWKCYLPYVQDYGLFHQIYLAAQQIADGKTQRKRLLDAYEAGVIELHEFVSRRNACDKKIERAKMKLNDLYVVHGEELSGGNLINNIEEVCKSLSNGLESMDMGKKMRVCRDLIEKVIVKKYDIKIHYKFPVSSNFNTKRECQALQSD